MFSGTILTLRPSAILQHLMFDSTTLEKIVGRSSANSIPSCPSSTASIPEEEGSDGQQVGGDGGGDIELSHVKPADDDHVV